MAEYTVVAAEKKKEVEGKHGPMQVISLFLDDNGEAKSAEWFTRATTPIPARNSKVEGELTENPPYGWKFKKAQQGSFGGGFKSDPERERRIVRQHSQSVAVETMKLARDL